MKILNITSWIKNNLKNEKKTRFIFSGIINVLITNTILQISLFIFPIFFSTLISQIFNLNFGFYLYGKKVFKVKNLRKKQYFNFLTLNIFIWNINWIFISILNSYNISKNLSALILVPFLALISFVYQNYFIFVD